MCMLGRASSIVAWLTEARGECRGCLAEGRSVSIVGKGVVGLEGRG